MLLMCTKCYEPHTTNILRHQTRVAMPQLISATPSIHTLKHKLIRFRRKRQITRALPHCTRLVPQLHQMRVHIVKRSLPLHSPPPPPKNHHSFMYTSKKNMHSDIKYDIYEMTNDVQFWL